MSAIVEIKRRPFHEAIVDAIYRCTSSLDSDGMVLLRLINETEIPKGRDEIATAIDKHFGSSRKWELVREVKEGLLNQEQTAVNEFASVEKGSSLDELQQRAERLVVLLKDRHPGLMTWNMIFREWLQSLHKIVSQVLNEQ